MTNEGKELAEFQVWHRKQYGWYECPSVDKKLQERLDDRFIAWQAGRSQGINNSGTSVEVSDREIIDAFNPYLGYPVNWIVDFGRDVLSRSCSAKVPKPTPELKVSWWCHEWADTTTTTRLPDGSKSVKYSGWYDVITKDEPKVDGNQSRNKQALIALPDVIEYISSLCLEGSGSAPFAYAPMPEYCQIINGDNARNSMVVVREAGGAYQVPLYTSPKSMRKSLTVARIRQIAETVREEEDKGNMVLGQGYRAGIDGRYTIPQLPLVFNKFATALIADLESD